jgi:hypothetical protein
MDQRTREKALAIWRKVGSGRNGDIGNYIAQARLAVNSGQRVILAVKLSN